MNDEFLNYIRLIMNQFSNIYNVIFIINYIFFEKINLCNTSDRNTTKNFKNFRGKHIQDNNNEKLFKTTILDTLILFKIYKISFQ